LNLHHTTLVRFVVGLVECLTDGALSAVTPQVGITEAAAHNGIREKDSNWNSTDHLKRLGFADLAPQMLTQKTRMGRSHSLLLTGAVIHIAQLVEFQPSTSIQMVQKTVLHSCPTFQHSHGRKYLEASEDVWSVDGNVSVIVRCLFVWR